jgi:glycosyltransferase involved in cell wall biosynthesis
MTTDVTVILSAHLPWWAQSQTPHYLARLLAHRVRVLYVEPRLAWSRTTASFSWTQHRTFLRGPMRRVASNLWVYTPRTLPLGRFRCVASWNDRLFARDFRQALDGLPPGRIILWLADTQNGPLLTELLPEAPRLFHALDYFVTERDVRAAHRLAAHADLVLAATPRIRALLESDTPRVHVLRNGWDFASRALQETPTPEDLRRVPRPRVGLISYLSANLDYALLGALLERLPISLVCIGRPVGLLTREDRQLLHRVRTAPRAFFLGEKATDELPAYIHGFDLCIAPYKTTDRIYGSDPLKVYQYLAFGKPVVATPVEVLEQLHPLVKTGRRREEFLRHVMDELSTPLDHRLERRRRRFAENVRWESRWAELEPVLAGYPGLAVLCGRSAASDDREASCHAHRG